MRYHDTDPVTELDDQMIGETVRRSRKGDEIMQYNNRNSEQKETLEEGLTRRLRRCELEYRADYCFPELCEIEWLKEVCDSMDGIVAELRDLGYRIREIVDDVDSFGDAHQWVVTTNGIIVYRNSGTLRGLAGRSRI